MIIEKDLFIYLFDIIEYYKYSDFLIGKVFNILKNIIKAKNEDIHDMVRYLIEDTPLVPFLINNAHVINLPGQVEEQKVAAEKEDEDKQTMISEGDKQQSQPAES
jgi:hypothetical protein